MAKQVCKFNFGTRLCGLGADAYIHNTTCSYRHDFEPAEPSAAEEPSKMEIKLTLTEMEGGWNVDIAPLSKLNQGGVGFCTTLEKAIANASAMIPRIVDFERGNQPQDRSGILADNVRDKWNTDTIKSCARCAGAVEGGNNGQK